MKKIGILTFHRELNYGAVLQTYALQTEISKNQDVCVIDFSMKKPTKSCIREIVTMYKKHQFNQFIKKELKLSKKIENEKELEKEINAKNSVIVGSDQVWAIDLINHYENVYFLDFAMPNTQKISYAASFGKDETIYQNMDKIQKYLSSFHKISIREKSASDILNKNGLKTTNNVDPTLLLTKEEYIKNLKLKKNNKQYILVYMLEIDNELINVANEIAKKLNLKIVFFNRINRFGKNGISKFNASPKEFVELFYNASFVITNSFHGTCFSIIFEKNFITFLHKEKGIRQFNLLEQAGLTEHIYEKNKDISDYLSLNTKINENLKQHIIKSRNYLNKI